jgi:tetratricopeptide (TPR) repeat protein
LELGPNDVDVLILSAGNLPFVGQPHRGPDLAERAVRLNPFYPYWWHYMLRWAYFFDRQFDKAFGAATKISTDAPNDLGYLAMIASQLDKSDEASAAGKKVMTADPDWSVERYVDGVGGFAREIETDLLIESARKAGLQACMTADQVLKYSATKHLKACEVERLASASG